MKIDTKFTHNGLPVLVTGGTFHNEKYIDPLLAIQARVTYENGDTEYVEFKRLQIHQNTVSFSAERKGLATKLQERKSK